METSRTRAFASLPAVQLATCAALSALNRKVRFAQLFLTLLFLLTGSSALSAQEHAGGEANLKLPDLSQATFMGGANGRTLLMGGLVVAALGLVFGLLSYTKLRNLPVHASMLEISELIYETCKTYLATQGKFLMILELFIGSIIVLYFGFLQHMDAFRVIIILLVIFAYLLVARVVRGVPRRKGRRSPR